MYSKWTTHSDSTIKFFFERNRFLKIMVVLLSLEFSKQTILAIGNKACNVYGITKVQSRSQFRSCFLGKQFLFIKQLMFLNLTNMPLAY